MKERPILFSAPMVRAILDGRKTQTRRVLKSQPFSNGFIGPVSRDVCVHNEWLSADAMLIRAGTKANPYYATQDEWLQLCPYGAVGDRLWVRETFSQVLPARSGKLEYNGARLTEDPDGNTVELWYRADGEMGIMSTMFDDGPRWTPSIHMPRWASRLTLEITGVRVERLQDISDEDALSEGMTAVRNHEFDLRHWPEWRREFDTAVAAGIKPPLGPSFVQTFQALWGDINGADSWDANPYVWVVEFRRVGGDQ